MHLILSPCSGLDNSYFDVMFTVHLSEVNGKSCTITLWNGKEQLNILSTSSGFIKDNNTLVCTKTPAVLTGWINLFNDDKMNRQLDGKVSVPIRCRMQLDDQIVEETQNFYNENFSADRNILPFFAEFNPAHVDLTKDSEISLKITTQEETSLHLQITFGSQAYDFHILAAKGENNISIPCEVIYNVFMPEGEIDLRLNYLKSNGITPFNVVNKKAVPVPNCVVTCSNLLQLKPQKRLDPVGRTLNYNEFPVSSEYFVAVNKKYNHFKVPEVSNKTYYGSLLKNEILETQTIEHPVTSEKRDSKLPSDSYSEFYASIFNSYIAEKKTVTPEKLNTETKKKDCGCSRKKNKINTSAKSTVG